MIERNYGILTSIDWNSFQWQAESSPADISHSNYGYVIENGITFTFLNFGHEIYPTDEKGYYRGLVPQLWSREPDKDKVRYVEIVFMKSQNWQDKQNYIVGFYAFPIFGKCNMPSPVPSFPREFELNVKAFPNDIHLLENYINLTAHPELQSAILPKGKLLGKQGYNYLTKENVFKILDIMTTLNPTDVRLKGIKYRVIQSISSKR
ncbi:MAG: hypothetical protein D4R64_15270 [Porphyromonadaceae bacterium]|nr:MAG: hypothetical protein D4R64_15270 [Porphyromonadaceae bacterium]